MKDLTKTITTWKDVVEAYNDPSETDLPFKEPKNDAQEAANAHWRIMQTIKFFKQGEKCDFSPGNNQLKYFTWMEWIEKVSGFRFNGSYFGDSSASLVGSRLCSLKREYTEHIATVVCKEDYEKYFTE